jgi:hypothetical protein
MQDKIIYFISIVFILLFIHNYYNYYNYNKIEPFSNKSNILFYYLGGTIGEEHVNKGKGLQPVKGHLEK